MRTASNSILSVLPETQSKNAKMPTPSKGEGRVFADDLSKAKAVLAPKQTSSSEQSTASPVTDSAKHAERAVATRQASSSEQASTLKTTNSAEHTGSAVASGQKALDANSSSANVNSLEHHSDAVADKAQAALVAEGGKKLQLAGAESPVAELVADKVTPTSATLLSGDDLLSTDNQALAGAMSASKGKLQSDKVFASDSEAAITQHTLKGEVEPLPANVQSASLMTASVPTLADEEAKQSHTGRSAQQPEPILSTTTTLSNNSLGADSAIAAGAVQQAVDVESIVPRNNGVAGQVETSALPLAVGTAKETLVTGVAGNEVASALPLQTEVAKGIKEAQLSASSAQSMPLSSRLLTSSEFEQASMLDDEASSAGLLVSGGVAGLALSQTELASDGTALTPEQAAALSLNESLPEAGVAPQQSIASKELIDASTDESVVRPVGGLSSVIAEEGVDAATVSDSGIMSAGALGLAALGSLGEFTDKKTNAAILGEKSKGQLEDSALDEDVGVAEDGELSWVLSQMPPSVDSVDPLNVAGAAVTAAAVAAPMVGNDKRQQVNQTTAVGLPESSKGLNVGQMPPMFLNEGNLQSSGSDNESKFTDMMGDDGVLLSEPVELRKKEQDAMIGRMTAQSDGTVVKGDLDTGGMNSSFNSNNANRLTLGAGAVNLQTPNAQTNLTMNLPPNHPGWASEMTQKVAWVARDGGHTAHIRLDPPELGSLTVKVSVDHDANTQVSFVAATPQARDLLEGQMSRLRDMLAQQGMDLSHVDVDVSQQDASGTQYRESAEDNAGARMKMLAQEEGEDDLPLSNVSYTSAAGIDYYA
ncbi:flagellar hook-length control protein FliK [Marinomonas transparens]|uniref:Flagellar hook-length control protein FliK n=1 Tax=Marinomonas transparens TaxID=2795388 RepID=A0A934N1K9_9GAMM|nr:flagellar hook-length control protein FliK [Marinomonas transparens]MBJ7536798.1 flagellar hook-length control protein FliK [Marinomonas transparens]